MIAPQDTARKRPGRDEGVVAPGASPDPMTTLRGATVEVDMRRAGRLAAALCVVTLVALTVAFFVAGAEKNAHITELREHGVPVEVTVSTCLGLLGGSGSNGAGYACSGTFSIDGHRYYEAIPGDTLLAPGTRLRAVADPGHPGLFSTASEVASEHSSSRVFILPAVLLVVLVLVVLGLVLASRRRDGPAS